MRYVSIYFGMSYLLYVASAVLLYHVVFRVTRRRLVAFLMAVYFGLDLHFLKCVVTGVETPLLVFLMLLLRGSVNT